MGADGARKGGGENKQGGTERSKSKPFLLGGENGGGKAQVPAHDLSSCHGVKEGVSKGNGKKGKNRQMLKSDKGAGGARTEKKEQPKRQKGGAGKGSKKGPLGQDRTFIKQRLRTPF